MSKYEVGDKAAIEILGKNMTEYIIEDYTRKRIYIDKKSLDGISEPLSTYTEPLERKNENKQKRIEKLVDRLHNQAAEIARLLEENKRLKAENGNVIWEIEQAFDRGCNAAWELARKIILPESLGGMNDDDYVAIFGSGITEAYIMKNYTYPEAAAKLVVWEKAREEIKVGDVYKGLSGNFVICGIDREKEMVKVLWDDLSVGKRYLYEIKDQYTKTGRHIDIDSFLKQIGEE